MKKSTSARLERLRKARSINDVVSIIQEIAKEVNSSKRDVSNLEESLSASRKIDDVGEISIDHQRVGATRPTKVRVGSPKATADRLGGVKLTKFVVPPMETVTRHMKVISDLHDNAVELESAEAFVKQAFGKAKNQRQVLSALKGLRAEVDTSLAKAFTALDTIAKKHLPTEMEQLGDSLVAYLMDHINPRSYSNFNKEVYVSNDENGDIVFSVYVIINDLVAKTGFTYDEFYVILTGVVNAHGEIHYFLNTMPDFKVPGKFPIGKEIHTTADMTVRISTLIAYNDIVADLEKRPLPLSRDRAKTGGFTNITNVDDAYVLDDLLCIVVTKGKDGPRVISNIASQVIPLLTRLTNNSRGTKGAITYNTVKRKGNTVIQFALTPGVANEKHTLNSSRLQELRDFLELSEDEVDAIKTILKQKS